MRKGNKKRCGCPLAPIEAASFFAFEAMWVLKVIRSDEPNPEALSQSKKDTADSGQAGEQSYHVSLLIIWLMAIGYWQLQKRA